MDVQFGEHGTHRDLSGKAADIGLFRMTRPKTRKTLTTPGSAPLADGRTDRRILSHTVWGAIALGLGTLVAAGMPDICLAASPATSEAPDAQIVIASADPHSSAIDLGISLRPTPISPDQFIRKAQRHGSKPMFHTVRSTAVYDIAAHIVYMPNGERLEAHSGLGDMLDDPDQVDEKDRGPTPPNVYDLVLREQPFHGVQALRLVPVGSGEVYGRDGFLAHSYMLGSQGFSNGCVAFKNYNKFLEGYLKGEVKRLVVVARMSRTGSPRQFTSGWKAPGQSLQGQQIPTSRSSRVRPEARIVHRLPYHEARWSAQGGKGVGMMDARNKQPSRRPGKPAMKDSGYFHWHSDGRPEHRPRI